MAESLPTRAAVVLPLGLLKHFLTGVARLRGQEEDFFCYLLYLRRLSVTTVIRLYLNCSVANGACLCLSSATHSDLIVWSPVRRGNLVSQPGCNSLGGTSTVLGHRLNHVVHPIQDPLSSILMVGQKGVRLRKRNS